MQGFQIVNASSEKLSKNATNNFKIQDSNVNITITESDVVNHITNFSEETVDRLVEENGENSNTRKSSKETIKDVTFEEINKAVRYGLKVVDDLVKVKEPLWYKMGMESLKTTFLLITDISV